VEEERETEGRKRKELSRTGKEREREGAERLGKRERRGEGPAMKSWNLRARRGRGRKARVRKGKGREARDASGKRRERRGEGGLNSNENKIHFGGTPGYRYQYQDTATFWSGTWKTDGKLYENG
jgi:hypothetical protein